MIDLWGFFEIWLGETIARICSVKQPAWHTDRKICVYQWNFIWGWCPIAGLNEAWCVSFFCIVFSASQSQLAGGIGPACLCACALSQITKLFLCVLDARWLSVWLGCIQEFVHHIVIQTPLQEAHKLGFWHLQPKVEVFVRCLMT